MRQNGPKIPDTEVLEPTHGAAGRVFTLDDPQKTLDFLAQKNIGVVGWAFDIPGTIVSDFNGTPTTFIGEKCGDSDGGAGTILQAQFKLLTPSFN